MTLPAKAIAILAALCAGQVQAAGTSDCDWMASADFIAEPWSTNTRSFANGAVRLAKLDVIEPAAAPFHLLVLAPPYGPLGERQCHVISSAQAIGWGELYFDQLSASYDPTRGLVFQIPAQTPDLGSAPENLMVEVTLNQSTGAVTVTESPVK